jgi:hypothetical protein
MTAGASARGGAGGVGRGIAGAHHAHVPGVPPAATGDLARGPAGAAFVGKSGTLVQPRAGTADPQAAGKWGLGALAPHGRGP